MILERKTTRPLEGYEVLLRHIQSVHLEPGDRLPPQRVLCRLLGISNYAMTKAMERLTQAGYLGRTPKRGTVVLNPATLPRVPWRVGLIAGTLDRPLSWFQTTLSFLLTRAIEEAGNHHFVFPQITRKPGVETDLAPMERLPRLRATVETGGLNAVISSYWIRPADQRWLENQGIPVLMCTGSEHDCPAVSIDQEPMGRDGTRHLLDRGCQRPAYVSPRPPNRFVSRAWRGFKTACLAAGLTPAAVYSDGVEGIEGGVEVARRLLALPAAQRPDGLLVTDDWLAAGIMQGLVPTPSYRPRYVCQVNREACLPLLEPALVYEVVMADLVEMGMRRLSEALRGRWPEGLEWYQPRPREYRPFLASDPSGVRPEGVDTLLDIYPEDRDFDYSALE